MKRDFLSLKDLTLAEARHVFEDAAALKRARGQAHPLAGKSVAIVMEKASTRTRVSFEVGVAELGAHPVVLTQEGSQLARGEPIRDTARVLSRYVHLIVFRTSTEARLEEMRSHATVPVINALSDDGHPVQVLCDIFTIEEALGGPITGKRVAWIGDGASNMARSFLEAAALFDFELVVGAPAGYRVPGARCVDDARSAAQGADVVCTDVWTSMGQEVENARRLRDLAGFTVDDAVLAAAHPDAIVLHCLPAHRGEEITDAVLEGPRSRVWEQAENRLHVQKALLRFVLEHHR